MTAERLNQSDLVYIPVERLALDLENPRLPEESDDWDESRTVAFLKDRHNLDEIIESMLSNGFFQQEPLIVLREPDARTNRHVVVEGNRRLAALMFIHGVVDGEYLDEEPSDQQLQRLQEIPCVVVDSREAVRTYLGFRHIGGIKDWSPEAKARFVRDEVERAAGDGDPSPFYRVGRLYGSNSQGIRNLYFALVTLRYAKEECGLDIAYVQYERFGVWQRLMNSATVKEYIGFGSPRSYSEIQDALHRLDGDRLKQVIKDLSPPAHRQSALVSDSRDITKYGKVLTHPRALDVLRETRNLEAAYQVVHVTDLPTRIGRIAASLEAMEEQVQDAPWSDELHHAVEDLYRASRSMKSELTMKRSDGDADVS
ncbi:MAG: ParB N-terminal domain-containing protein [Myxococcota bacterium]